MKPSLLRLFCISLFIILVVDSSGQSYDPARVNKNAVGLYEQAMQRIEDGNYALATGLLVKAVETDPGYVDALLTLGGLYGRMKNHATSIAYYEKAFAIDSVYTIEYKFQYSINLAGLGEFEKALAAMNDLLAKKPPKNQGSLKRAEDRKRTYEFAIDYAKQNADKNYVFAPKNLGPAINTAESEYFPSFTVDGAEMVFTRNLKGRNEDFFFSRKKPSGELDNARPVEGMVNTEHNEGAQMISQDGQWLVFTGCQHPGGYGSCDIYLSYQTPSGWSEPLNMGPVINTDQWDSQPCLSPNKLDLYFASRRPGGYGGSDIYVSHLRNGSWTEPENLGPEINTKGDEACPFIHADNQTLYFSSDGLLGYGDNDFFYVKRSPDGTFGKPVNLGYPINTIHEEGTLFIASDGKTAYFASDRGDSRGGLDIYSFELRENVRPVKTLWVKGNVHDKKTSVGLSSVVELVDLSTNQMINRVITDKTGNYLITLPVGKDYAFNVNREGYLFYSDNFMLSKVSPDSTYQKDIALQPIEANAVMVLKNVFFDNNQYELKPESRAELDVVVRLMNSNPGLRIEIGGHTDNVGKPADNLTLSNNRAKAVISYLVSKNISPQRLSSKGYGETKPVADNKTEEGRAQNRRTELKVVGQDKN
jgi:outer membrane protein OmpA-like peptidoglycan-associated protein